MSLSLTVSLQEILCPCIIGVYPDERLSKRSLLLNIAYRPKEIKGMKSDLLAEMVDYAAITARAQALCLEGEYHLIEALVYRIWCSLLDEFPLEWLCVKVQKNNPLHDVASSSAEISGTRP